MPGPDFAPGVAERLAAQGVSVEPVAAIAAPRFVGGASRSQAIPMDWPVEYAGRVYDVVVLKRMTHGEVRDFMEALRSTDEAGRKAMSFPIFYHSDGSRVPDVVMDALDPDDRAKLDEAAESFLPRQFRSDPPEPGSVPQNGGITAPS